MCLETEKNAEFCLELESLVTNCRGDKFGIKHHLGVLLNTDSFSKSRWAQESPFEAPK